jgi:NAD(P)H-dependent FMN reductase
MADEGPVVLCVAGSLQPGSATSVCLEYLVKQLSQEGVQTGLLDLGQSPLPLFRPEATAALPELQAVRSRVAEADVLVLGTPDYHGCMSGALKNFLDYLWVELTGRLIVPLVVSNEKGLTVLDQIRTVARQCYAWALPYGISVAGKEDVKAGVIVGDLLRRRLDMASRDIRVYGALLAAQRRADLAGADPGFMARYRSG